MIYWKSSCKGDQFDKQEYIHLSLQLLSPKDWIHKDCSKLSNYPN